MSENNKPVHRIRLGAIAASVFANRNKDATYYNVQFDLSYKDGEEWAHTRSFGRDDLLTLAKVADLAHTWIHAQQRSENEQNAPGPAADMH
ncbi:hypothetical protein SH139x_005755 [Planctomycetaceae bacterium SH139]